MALCRQALKAIGYNYRIVVNRSFMMSAQLRAEEAVEEIKKTNPYYGKYASKIAALQQTAPDEFLQRVDSVNKSKSPPKQEKPR